MSNTMSSNRQTEEFMTIQEFWVLCLTHFHWFFISLAVTLALAVYYLVTTPDLYTREAAILVKVEHMGSMVTQNGSGTEFNNMALIQPTTKVPDVQRQFSSLSLLADVARRLQMATDTADLIRQASALRSKLTVSIDNEQSAVLNLKYVDTAPFRAEQVLNTIIDVYNERWLLEKNQMARSGARFIDDRLNLIEKELSQVDDSISAFKMRHQITNLERVSDLYLQQQTESEADILRLSNQVSMSHYILDILQDKETLHQLLPANLGLANSELESLISQYNTQLLRLKNNLVSTSSQNPLIMQQESELDEIRQNIIATVTNQMKTLQIQLQSLERYNEDAQEKVTSSPDQAKRLLSVERDQKVKESLYLFLLQKKEENEISMTYTPVPTQIIDMPHGSAFPTFPQRKNILLAAFLMGLLLPAVILFIQVNLDTSVRNKTDVENRSLIPIIGEVPYHSTERRSKWRRLLFKKKKQSSRRLLLVERGLQDGVNEAFRLIRSNMEFMHDQTGHKNVYIVTSMYAGSGKTFTSTNLSVALAIKNHRVLLIDGDLRRSSATRVFGNWQTGLADYLSEKVDSVESVIYPHQTYPTLFILPVGTTPPNPTELLSSPRMEELIQDLRPKYDFILIDCPMTETLADTSIIQHLADRTLFIIRVGLFQRREVNKLDANVEAGKYKNLSIILNAVKPVGRYLHHYSYYHGYASYGYFKFDGDLQ